jgi:murein DD-endopeptidase MepM/ murein hydrolase activator NlpD
VPYQPFVEAFEAFARQRDTEALREALGSNAGEVARIELRVYKKTPSVAWQRERTLGPTERYQPGANEKIASHEGIDYRSRDDQDEVTNQPFTTPVGGTVEVVDPSDFNTVGVRAADGSLIQFLHASELDVVNGQEVSPGDQIGLTGDTAPYDIPIHLHVQATDPNGNPVNPDCVDGHYFVAP